ncbi:hypothetical protein P8452_56619 [Trifolium repens]|nr:hypothetical protein P8452_56619 [Trifolium repens]
MWSLIYVWIHHLKIMPMLQQFRIKMIQVIVNVAQQQSMVVVHNQRPTKNGNLNLLMYHVMPKIVVLVPELRNIVCKKSLTLFVNV